MCARRSGRALHCPSAKSESYFAVRVSRIARGTQCLLVAFSPKRTSPYLWFQVKSHHDACRLIVSIDSGVRNAIAPSWFLLL